jgi:UPF0716 protein FxsA
MRQLPPFHSLLRTEALAKLLLTGLLLSLILLLDGYVLILLSRRVGIYLLLATTASTGLVGVVTVLSAHRSRVRELEKRVGEGIYPAREFRHLMSLVAAGACLLIPGLATDGIGVLLLIPPMRSLVGWSLEAAFREPLTELYEYLRIEH